MNLSRDHHVVPQFHLKRFADTQRRVRQLSDRDRDGTLVPVKRATVRDGFYNILTRNGEEHDGWEKIFGRFETPGARAVTDIVDYGVWPLPDRQREHLANWLSAQYLRTPAFRHLLDESLESWRSEIDRAGRAAIVATVARPDLTDDEAVALWQRGDILYPRGEPQSSNTHLRWFQDMLWDTAKAFYERRWVLMRFPEPALLTADNAVVPIDDREQLHPIAASARLVCISLDRRHILQMVDAKPHIDVSGTGDPMLAQMHNAMVLHHRAKYVYQHPEDDFARNLWDLPEKAS